MPLREPTSNLTADRVLQVLAVLARQGRMLAQQLMAQIGLARSTLYRQLARLKRWGFDLSSHLSRHARPQMLDLAQQSHESVGLIVAVNDRAICLDTVEREQSLRCSFDRGRGVALRARASARCLLAHLPDADRNASLQAHSADPAQRLATHGELDAIRQAGDATSAGQVDAGVWGVSVPLFGAPRQALGALTLMAPIVRAPGQEGALMAMTTIAAAHISRELARP